MVLITSTLLKYPFVRLIATKPMRTFLIVIGLALLSMMLQEDASAKIKRSHAARREFIKLNPCPSTGKTGGRCPGYVIDHIVPLKRGGPDTPSNMQWQTREDAKAKDKSE